MKQSKFSVPNKTVDEVCKELEQMFRDVLGTNPKKEKEDKAIIYHPARRFMGTDDLMDDVKITVRKVNNSLTSIKLENSEYFEKQHPDEQLKEKFHLPNENWRAPALRKAYSTLDRVLHGMYQ